MNTENKTNKEKEHVSKHEIILTDKKSRKGLKILLIILGVIMLAGIVVGVLLWREVAEDNRRKNENSYAVFAEKLNIVKKVSEKSGKATFETVTTLPFGTTVELLDEDIINQDGKIYQKCSNYLLDHRRFVCEKNYYLEISTAYDLAESYSRDALLEIFPTKYSQQLPVMLRHEITEFMNGTPDIYRFTQDPNRAAESVIKADLNLDGEDDYAVLMQSGTIPADQKNRIIIMCYNPDVPKYYVAATDYYFGFASIRFFRKDAQIFADSETLVAAPNSGIMYQYQLDEEASDYQKYAFFYDPKLKQFRQCVQVPKSQTAHEDEVYEVADEPDNDEIAVDSIAIQ